MVSGGARRPRGGLAVPTHPTLEEQIDIRIVRQGLGIRLHEVAAAMGCSISYISLIETGILNRPAMVAKIRKYLARQAQRRMGR